MLRFAKALALVLALGAGARADVVLGTSPGDLTDSGDAVYAAGTQNYAGFSFTTTGSSAGSGRWSLTNLAFNLKASAVGSTANSYDLYLYKVISGDTLSGTWVYRQQNISLGGASILNTGNGTSFSTALTGFGTIGDENTGLEANTKYYLGFDFNLTAPTQDVFIQASSNNYSGTWGINPAVSYSDQANPTSISSINSSLSTTNYGYSLSAVAVPEPGTLLLGGIAAVGGAGGWWARRRKKVAAADAVAEGEQAATV